MSTRLFSSALLVAFSGFAAAADAQAGAAPSAGSSTVTDTIEQFTLEPQEYVPPPPLSAQEVETLSVIDAAEKDAEHYVASARSFRGDIKELIKIRYEVEKGRVGGQFERSIRLIEDTERDRRLEAIARFEEFLQKYPDDPFYSPDAMFRLAELYFEKSSDEYLTASREYDASLQRFEAGIEKGEQPEAPRPNYDKTIDLYKELLARFPDYRHADAARYLLGYSFEEQEQREAALEMYVALVEKNPDSRFAAEVWTRIGEIYFDENQPGSLEKAGQAYAKVLAFSESPYYDKALYKLAWTYYRLNRFDDAVARFIELVEYSDQLKKKTGKSGSELRAEAIQYIAISLADDNWGGMNRAEAILNPLAQKDYTGEIWKRYGEIVFDQTRYELAIRVLQTAIDRYPNAPQNPDVQAKIVLAYERLRDFDNATLARETLVAKYAEGSPWYVANQDNKVALESARELAEKSLFSAAIFNHQQAQTYKKAGRLAEAQASYVRAAANYRSYLDRFPDSKNAYDFNFYLAECLFYSDDFLGAAKQYELVRDSTLDNRNLDNAALSAVIAYEKEIEAQVAQKKLDELQVVTNEKRTRPIQAAPIAPIRQALIDASDRFVTLLPNSERAPAVAYRAAEVFYKHDQLEEARARFEKIVIKYPGNEVARFSANLIIESYLAVEDWPNVKKWSARLIEIAQGAKPSDMKEAADTDKFVSTMKDFEVGAMFKQAEKLDREGKYEDAANLYVGLVDSHPEHQFADKALFNAAVAYEKVRRYDTASKIYSRIYDTYPKSDLADQALFRVGVNYEKGFDFTGAISAYTRLVERYPNSKQRADALYNVAVTLENMQQYGQAAAAYKRYATTFPDREDAGDVYFRAAQVYQKMEAWPDEISTLQSFITTYRKDRRQRDRIVQAHMSIGEAHLKQDQNKKAIDAFKECESEYKRLDFSPQDRASAYAATCVFEIAEDGFRKYDLLRIAGSGKRQIEALKTKAVKQREAESAYKEVYRFKRVETTLAALYRIGHTYERFAEAMYAAEVPPELQKDDELVLEYKDQLAQKAQVLERKAEFAYRKAYEEAKKTRVTNEWTERILEGLNKYQPEEFPVQKSGKPAMQTVNISGNGLDSLDASEAQEPNVAPPEAEPAPQADAPESASSQGSEETPK